MTIWVGHHPLAAIATICFVIMNADAHAGLTGALPGTIDMTALSVLHTTNTSMCFVANCSNPGKVSPSALTYDRCHVLRSQQHDWHSLQSVTDSFYACCKRY